MVVLPKNQELAELHFHLGLSLDPHILWSIAHEQGIKLPTKSYWEFFDLITLNKDHISWEDYHKLFHWTETIQSSPLAMERTVYEVITGAYRANNITVMEPSFNPMFRNRGGEQDLDHLILASLRGMERALVEYPMIRAGLILGLDRRLTYEQNAIIVKKAIKYRTRGIVGIDIAGPHKEGFDYKDYSRLYKEAQEGGLKTSVHTGEDGDAEEMAYVLQHLSLNRINHGIKAHESAEVMKEVVKRNLTLCICPTSNTRIGFVKGWPHYKKILGILLENEVKFCINTDNPAMHQKGLRAEIQQLLDHDVIDESQMKQAIQWAFDASFIPTKKGQNLYL
ncbi:adenosine deaminase [Candidatus Microgenomates bacterium]|nr:adenosine deaminase [Candidatus Microgenomates bacterium]